MSRFLCTASRSWLGAVVLLALWASAASGLAEEPDLLDGTWRIASLELGSIDVPELVGAELTLHGGKKELKLPSGQVEKGTYELDPEQSPSHIDSTTAGQQGTQRGIFRLEGDRLAFCLSRAGNRPTEFSTAGNSDLMLIHFRRVSTSGAEAKSVPKEDARSKSSGTGPRQFRLGFTGFVYDVTPPAVEASRRFVREHGDILAHHIEGVPWGEAFRGEPLPKALREEWEGKKLATPKNGKVYLAISPGRGELKLAEKAGPLPAELRGKDYDDPEVIQAYLTYCRQAIEFFRPDYLAIGIEVNEIHRDPGPKAWKHYVTLHKQVYEALKGEHPDLPIFASWTLHAMFQDRKGMLEAFKELMPHNDLVAVSYYPFFVPEASRLTALDWMTEQFDEFDKPYAMVETNDAAERLPLPQAKVTIEGTPEKQLAYYRRLLELAQERKFAFVISFVHQDYDALWERIKANSPELFIAWRDCGLLDQDGKPRPALGEWQAYFERPLPEPATEPK